MFFLREVAVFPGYHTFYDLSTLASYFYFLSSRPATSFLWITSPWKTFKMIIWKHYKWHIIGTIIGILIVLILAIVIYTLPVRTLPLYLPYPPATPTTPCTTHPPHPPTTPTTLCTTHTLLIHLMSPNT